MTTHRSRPSIATVRWLSVDEAASILGMKVITLRRTLERNARRGAGGVIEVHVDGLRARKFGRLWRVLLDDGWMGNSAGKNA